MSVNTGAGGKITRINLFRSPWLELITLGTTVLLSFVALLMISRGAEVPPGGMALSNISWLLIGFFVLSFAIAIIAVLAGIGGGVIYTPIMLAFTPVNSLIVRATGLIVAMCGGITSSGILLKSGIANLKLSIFSTLGYGVGGFIGAQGAIYIAKNMGATGEGVIRMVLAGIVLLMGLYFLFSGKKTEWPVVAKVDRFTAWLGLSQPYHEQSTNTAVDYKAKNVGVVIFFLLGAGLISGFFGMGAGWAMVPALNLVTGLPLKVAAASSHVIIGLGDGITIWPYVLVGAIIPLFVAPWLVGQVLGGIVGSHVLIHARAKSIRYILIGIMFYTCFGLVSDALVKLNVITKMPGSVYLAVLLVVLAVTILAIINKLPGFIGGGKKRGQS